MYVVTHIDGQEKFASLLAQHHTHRSLVAWVRLVHLSETELVRAEVDCQALSTQVAQQAHDFRRFLHHKAIQKKEHYQEISTSFFTPYLRAQFLT